MEHEYISRTELFKLMQRNPDLPVVPMIDGEVCGDDDYARYIGSWGKSYITEYIVGEETVYFRESNPDMCEVEDVLTDCFVSYDDLECMPDEEAKAAYDCLPWIKAILVNIDLRSKED